MGAGTIPDATFDRIGAVLTRALDGLTFEQLKRQPAGPESNPIGWLAFHLIRVHDINFSHLLKKDTVWSTEQWYEKFGVPAETGNLGGSTLDEVRAFEPAEADVFIGYWEAARARSREFLEALRDDEIDTPTPHRAGSSTPPETYKTTIARATSDSSQHIGQIAYARGLVDQHGWYGA